jgi:hypothetical protein
MKKIALLLFISTFVWAQKPNLKTPFEKNKGNTTATYQEVIDYYSLLAKNYKEIKIVESGTTDIGKPLHTVIISGNKEFRPEKLRAQNKPVVLIMNGIHPGEPEGIDASMMLARDLVTKPQFKPILQDVVVVIIPIYNVDGALNRNSHSRTNQNGPESYGFRGNAKNLDLNRDFIKCDSKNAKSFAQIFHTWQPHIFIDTHTSNGADYQYVITYIPSQKDKLQKDISELMTNEIQPALEKDMINKGFELCTYVNTIGDTPESGISGFLETPRYSTGYAALFNCIGFVVETHMLKPFDKRLQSTYAFLASTLNIAYCDKDLLVNTKKKADNAIAEQKTFALQWKLDTIKYENIAFKGFKSGYKNSQLSGLPQLYYDTTQAITFDVKFYNNFQTPIEVEKPFAYIIPQAYSEIIDLFKLNNIALFPLKNDTIIEVENYYITDYKTTSYPYENHYLHSNTKVLKKKQKNKYFKGDYLVFTNQKNNRYIIETLEPEATDSFFNWNFFDGILMQKEYFSDYVFEAEAVKMLEENPSLKQEFEEKLKADTGFAKSQWQQLYFLYKKSPHYEQSHQKYPVGKLLKP